MSASEWEERLASDEDPMSIFPDHTHPNPAKHDGAEPRAIASPEGANAQGAGAGAAASAANSTEHKLHRFDKFALRIASGMITAIRVTLGVFSSPDKERWPFARLLDHLRGAETLAREMLREIAAEISIIPGKLRERRKQEVLVSGGQSRNPKPYFRLGVSQLSRTSGESKLGAGADAPSQAKRSEETASSTNEKKCALSPDPSPANRERGTRTANLIS